MWLQPLTWTLGYTVYVGTCHIKRYTHTHTHTHTHVYTLVFACGWGGVCVWCGGVCVCVWVCVCVLLACVVVFVCVFNGSFICHSLIDLQLTLGESYASI